MRKCFYVPGSMCIVDVVGSDGKSFYGRLSLDEIQVKYPGAILIDLDAATDQIMKAQEAAYRTPPQEVTEERYSYMLGVLPPSDWHNTGATESFKLAERTTGHLTSILARIDDKYYEFCDSIALTHNQIVEKCVDIQKQV